MDNNIIVHRLNARIALLNDRNQLLLLKYSEFNEYFWLTPGGQVEAEETLQQAAQRELYEETGISHINWLISNPWYHEAYYTLDTIPVLFKEYIFVARTDTQVILPLLLTIHEQKTIQEYRWWHIKEFKESGEKTYPSHLLDFLETYINET